MLEKPFFYQVFININILNYFSFSYYLKEVNIEQKWNNNLSSLSQKANVSCIIIFIILTNIHFTKYTIYVVFNIFFVFLFISKKNIDWDIL